MFGVLLVIDQAPAAPCIGEALERKDMLRQVPGVLLVIDQAPTAPCIGEAFERKHMLGPSAGVLLLISQAIPAPCKVSRSSSRVAARLGGWSAGV